MITFKYNALQSFHFFFILTGFCSSYPCNLFVEEIFVILYSCLQQFEVLVSVLLKFTDSNCQIIILLENNSLHKFLLFLQPYLQIIIKFIYLSIDLVLQLIKIFLNRS